MLAPPPMHSAPPTLCQPTDGHSLEHVTWLGELYNAQFVPVCIAACVHDCSLLQQVLEVCAQEQ